MYKFSPKVANVRTGLYIGSSASHSPSLGILDLLNAMNS